MSKRSGCNGQTKFPVTLGKNDLLTCLDDFTDDIEIDNTAYTRKTIRGVRSNSTSNFFKTSTGDKFIFFDSVYNKWRFGGGSAATVDVDCTTLDIC